MMSSCRSVTNVFRSARALSTSAHSGPVFTNPSVAEYPTQKLPARPFVQSISKSRFSEKRGQPHGAPIRQVKGIVSPMMQVPSHIEAPPYARGIQPNGYPEPEIHSLKGIERMKDACKLAAEVLEAVKDLVKPGITTNQIDDFVFRYIVSRNAYPSPVNYMGFPKSVCSSINEVVCHGIPDDTVILPGDIVKLDASVYLRGYHGDTCRTYIAGGPESTNETGRELVATTKFALDEAIKICGPGVPIARIGQLIGRISDEAMLGNVTVFAGHGIGQSFHTQPIVHHSPNRSPYVMKEGMTFTIEPILTEGTGEVVIWPDNWTAVTTDGGRAAQFEHTILITPHGAEVLTNYE